MHLVHALDPARDAQLTQSAPTSYLITWLDEAGKKRRKTFKKKWLEDARFAAQRFAFQQGFVMPAPGAQGLQWLMTTHEPFPVGPLFAVDRAARQVWVGDTGFLRRIQPGTCQATHIALGQNARPRAVACSSAGHVAALLEVEAAPITGDSPWRAPSTGDSELVLCMVEGDQLRPLHTVPFPAGASVLDRVSVSRRGTLLGPHQDGAAIFDAQGQVLRSFPVARTQHCTPKGALQDSGALVAHTAPNGALGFLDVDSGQHSLVEAGFSQVHRVQVGDSGAAYVSGICQYWGVYQVRPGQAPRRVSPNVLATPTLDESGMWEAESDRVYLRSLEDPQGEGEPGPHLSATAHLPLGMARRAEIQPLSTQELVLQTDNHRLAGVALDSLGEPKG